MYVWELGYMIWMASSQEIRKCTRNRHQKTCIIMEQQQNQESLKHYKQKQKTQGKMRVTSETFPRGCDVDKKALDWDASEIISQNYLQVMLIGKWDIIKDYILILPSNWHNWRLLHTADLHTTLLILTAFRTWA